MFKKLLVLFVVMVLSVDPANAAEGKTKASASTAPLFKEPATGMEMVFVKGGCYKMGNIYEEYREDFPEELPVHEVCVDDFYLGKYEVTQGQWEKIMGSNPSEEISCGSDCPVQNISWNEAQSFIGKLNNMSGGSKYRLPTEAEFEYAQRSGGKNERYSGGDDAGSVAWYYKNARDISKTEEFYKINPVGKKAPNGLGIYDMSGNVWEWTNDRYGKDYYAGSPKNNPTGPASGDMRVIRGGCASGYEFNMRVSRRDAYELDYKYRTIGMRLLMIPY